MPRNWQKLEGGPLFKGTLQRRQQQVEDLAYWAELLNVDGYGGTLGKRPGTQIINGYGTVTQTGSTTTVIQLADATGFIASPLSQVYVGSDTRTITAVTATAPGTITLNSALPAAPGVDVLVTQVLSIGPIDTLFQAMFRDGTKQLFAAITNVPAQVERGLAPTLIVHTVAHTTVTVASSGANIQLTTTNGLVVGDYINFPTISNKSYQVKGIFGAALLLDQPIAPAVPVGAQVNFEPWRDLGNTETLPEMLQYNNRTHFTLGKSFFQNAPMPPLIIEKPNPAQKTYITRRHGVKPPFSPTTVTIITDPDGQMTQGTYEYRYRFYNSKTGQESEGSLPISATIPSTASNAVAVSVTGSPDPQVDQIRLYRTTNGGGGAWYRVTRFKVDNAAATTIPNPAPGQIIAIYDETGDDQLGAQMRDLMDFCVPDGVCILGIWGQANRLIGIDRMSNTVVYSDQPDLQSGTLKPEAWPLNNQIFVSYDDGDRLTGIATFVDAVLIFKEHSVWRITGVPPDIQISAVQFRQDATAAGAVSQRAITVDHDEVMYRGSDAVYELNRYQGQAEGFQSKRVSLPVDDLLQDVLNYPEERQIPPHAVYFRFKRQYRLWLTSERCLVLQFDATVQSEALGWSTWQLAMSPQFDNLGRSARCSAIARYEPTLFRGNIDPGLIVSPLDSGVFLGLLNGAILQMDIGQADYGGAAYPVRLRTLRFAPGGRGSGARLRALDWQVSPINTATPTMHFWSDMLEHNTEVTVQMSVPRNPDLFPTPQPPDTVDIIAAKEVPFSMYSVIVIVPGQFHCFQWDEKDIRSMYRILGWALWFQALPEAVVRRQVLEKTAAVIDSEAEPPVIQG